MSEFAVNGLTNMKITVPEFSKDDFRTPQPYIWVYGYRNNAWQMENARQMLSEKAKELGVPNFGKMWAAFLQSVKANEAKPADNATEFTNQPITLNCGAYKCDDSGVSVSDRYGNETAIIPHPIMPAALIQNIESREEKVKLAYRIGEKWQDMTVPNEVLSNSQKIVGLSSKGLGITSENARDVVRFLADIKSRNRTTLKTELATTHLGWQQDGTFSPYGNGIICDSDNTEYLNIYDCIAKPKGEESAWLELAEKVRHGQSVPARIALAASFAAPLISKLGGLSFFVHLWGTQGCGKTVGLMLAASVWGDPEIGKYPKTFQATKVALEGLASFCANLPVIYDELQVIADRQLYDDLIYMLCEGSSKSRGTRDGGLQVQKRWCTTIITSGEMPIVQGNSGGGAAVRTIEVNYGGTPLFEDAHGAAETLRANYGFAGRKLIEYLMDPEQGPTRMDQLRTLREKYYQLLAGEIEDKQVLAASIILAADAIANDAVFRDGKSLTPADIKPYLVTKAEADKQRRCYEWLMGFIAANDVKFHPDEKPPECWGTIVGDVVYFIRSKFDEHLKRAGYSSGAFLTWAKRYGVIETEPGDTNSGNKRLTVRKCINGSRVPCVALIRQPENEGDGSTEQTQSVAEQSGFIPVDPGEDMPF